MVRDARASLMSARELHRRGLTANELGTPHRAARLLTRALDVLDQAVPAAAHSAAETAEVRARVLITLANAEFELEGFERAVRRLAEAEAALEAAARPDLRVSLHNQRGLVLLRAGRPDRALVEFDAAEACFPAAPAAEQCRVLLNRGAVHLDLGDLRRARTDLTRCVDIATAGALDILAFKALHNLAYLAFLARDLPTALRLLDESARRNPGRIWGIQMLDRARVLSEAGLVREADEALSVASTIFRRDRLVQDLGETELDRARCALIGGDVRAARRWAASSRDRFRRRGNDRWRRGAELTLLQGDLAIGRPGSRLVEPALRLREEFEADGLAQPARTATLIAAEARLRAGEAGLAGALLDGLGRPTAQDPIGLRLHDREVRARHLRASGRRTEAARLVRGGLRELAAHQAGFGSFDIRAASAVHGRHLAELDILLALDTGRASAVLASAERARAVSTRLTPVHPPEDQVSADLIAELRRVVDRLRESEQDEGVSAALLRRRRELERQIAARRWTLAGTGDVGSVARLADVRAALRSDEALVSYVQVSGALHAVVVGDGRLRLCELGPSRRVVELARRVRADLDVLAYPHLPGPLAGAVRSSLLRSLTDLDDVLVRPLRLGRHRLVVSSTGSLGQLPWGALPSLRGVPVVVAPSATAWLSAATATGHGGEVVALAGPDLGRGVEEVAGVVAAHPGALALTGAAADGEAFTTALGKARILHVAAHGLHQTENPLFSSVRLADGVLFAHELDRTARTPDHVVLSACELGLATVRPGDEALGLTSVLLHLGTRSVVAGVARVGDEVAERTMVNYHRALAAGADSAAALAGALSGPEAADGAELPPPFVCFGAAWSAA